MKTRVTISETPKHPTCSHRVRYPAEGGEMKTKWFTNETEALAFKKKQEAEIGFNGSDFGTITDDERAGLAFWRTFRAKSPSTPDLLVVIRDYAKSWEASNASVTITTALDRYVEHQEAEGATDKHVGSVKSRVGRLTADHGDMLVVNMTEGKFADWLNALRGTRPDMLGKKLGLVTRDNIKRTCRSFFTFCIARGWSSVNPVPKPTKKRTREHRIAKRRAPVIMLPWDVEKFLHTVEVVASPILPFWLVKFFAGIRDAEAGRLDWSMIDLREGFIRVPASASKTGDARKVKIEPALADWLAPLAKKSGPLSPGVTPSRYYYKKALRHLRRPDKIGGKQKRGTPPKVFIFPSNAARHSFGTFHLYHFRDAGETALQLGHKGNPAMLHEHYANPAAEEHAAAFWAIRSGKEKVVSIAEGRRTA
jgi:integrase